MEGQALVVVGDSEFSVGTICPSSHWPKMSKNKGT